MLPWRGGEGVALAGGWSLTTAPQPAACGSVGRLCTKEGLTHQGRGVGKARPCLQVTVWKSVSTMTPSQLAILCLCPPHKRGEDAAPAGNKDASHPPPCPGASLLQTLCASITKGRLRRSLRNCLVWFGLVFDPQRLKHV